MISIQISVIGTIAKCLETEVRNQGHPSISNQFYVSIQLGKISKHMDVVQIDNKSVRC